MGGHAANMRRRPRAYAITTLRPSSFHRAVVAAVSPSWRRGVRPFRRLTRLALRPANPALHAYGLPPLVDDPGLIPEMRDDIGRQQVDRFTPLARGAFDLVERGGPPASTPETLLRGSYRPLANRPGPLSRIGAVGYLPSVKCASARNWSLYPHSEYPHTWHFTHPSANSSCDPQSGHVPMNASPPPLDDDS